MNILRGIAAVGLSAALVLGCASERSGDGQTLQGRREFALLKYRDLVTGVIPEGIRDRELAFAEQLPGSTAAILAATKQGEDVQQYGAWTHRGPANIGGRTRAIAFDVDNDATMLAGAVSGGVWKTTDSGSTWKLTTRPFQLHSVTCLAQDVRQGKRNTWYYGTGEIYGNSSQISGNGIWKSTDNGESWSQLLSTVSTTTPSNNQFAYTWRIVTHPKRDSNEVYVATARSGIYRSTNGGQTWAPTLTSNALFTDILITPSGAMYAALSATTGSFAAIASRWGIYRSTDGVTWTNVTPPGMDSKTARIVLSAVPQTQDDIMVLAETPDRGTQGSTVYRGQLQYEWHSIWKYHRPTGDTLGRWEDRSAGIPLSEAQRGDFYSQSGYDLFIRVSPYDSNLVLIGGTNLYRSTDAFRTPTTNAWIGGYWKDVPKWDRYSSYERHHPDQHDALFHPNDSNVVISANDGGIQRTSRIRDEKVVWDELNNSYLTTQFYTIAQEERAGSTRLMGGMQDNATWGTRVDDGRTHWYRLGGGDGAYCYYADGGRKEYYSSQQGRMYVIDRDATGTEISRARVDPPGSDNFLFINPYVLHPVDEHVMYLAGGEILWRNSDLRDLPRDVNDSSSVNWDSLTSTNVGAAQISAVCATSPAGSKDHRVYYATSNGKIFRIERAQEGMPQPIEITGATMPRAFVNSLTVHPSNPDHIYACFSNYGVVSIWESTNAGVKWTPISGNLEEQISGAGSGPAVNWLAVATMSDATLVLVAATSTGVYFTPQTNGMSTVWTQASPDEIGNVPCDMVIARQSDGQIAVASHGRGTFTGRITSLPDRPARVQLRTPVNMDRGIGLDTTLTWTPAKGATSYTVRLWRVDRPDSVAVFSGITAAFLDVTLEAGPVQYFWNVEAYGGGGGGGASESWSFLTQIRPPVLVSPAVGATAVTAVDLVWNRVPMAVGYGVEVGSNAAFNPVVAKVDELADTTVRVRGLDNNKRYFWRVRAQDIDATGPFSDRRSFVTGILTSVDTHEQNNASLRVEPNPASDHVTLCSPFEASTSWNLRITTVDGRDVYQQMCAAQCLDVSLATFAAGTYVVTVSQGTAVRSRSFSIVK